MKICPLLLLAVLAPALYADVVDANANGFTVHANTTINRPQHDVFTGVVQQISSWWDPKHTFSGDARNLTLDGHAPGCLCEKLPDGGSVRHLEVVYVLPGKLLRLTGGLGPLQAVAGQGVLTMTFTRQGESTDVSWTYTFAGYVPAGMNTWASPVDFVITEQLGRLKNFLERGDPALKNRAKTN